MAAAEDLLAMSVLFDSGFGIEVGFEVDFEFELGFGSAGINHHACESGKGHFED